MSVRKNCNELVAPALSGDKDAMSALVDMAAGIAKSKIDFSAARSLRIPTEDLIQEGLIGFVYALRAYSPEREASFYTFASVCIQNRIRNAVNSYRNEKSFSLSSAVPMPEQDNASDYAPDPQEIFAGWESLKIFKALISEGSNLSGLERSVVEMRLKGKSYKDIAAKLVISPKAVDNALSRVKKKLKAQV